MRRSARLAIIAPVAAFSACAPVGGPYPSLAPRAAEAIDPRVPVPEAVNDRAATPALTAQLAALVTRAHAGDAAFAPAMAHAEQMASAAGAPRSESWIAAQESLSAAIAARAPVTGALADIDALGAQALQSTGGLAPSDLAAIRAAGAEVAAIAERGGRRIDALHQRLGL